MLLLTLVNILDRCHIYSNRALKIENKRWNSWKLKKALGERRYLRQGKAIRQVASPSSLFPYAPFNAMVTKILKWSRIPDSCRITPKI